MNYPVWILIALFFAATLYLFLFLRALKKKRLLRALRHMAVLAFITVIAVACCAITIGMHGYRLLTKEVLAVTIDIAPLGGQEFQATLKFPGTKDTVFILGGDELYIDARIVKWRPLANLMGLHTWYRLDRIAGRYIDIRDEKTKERTIHALSDRREYLDLFWWRTRHAVLAPIIDAHYGSASFTPVKKTQSFDVMVSTTGLLIRPAVSRP